MSTAAPSLFEYWPRRLTVVILCFLSALICYIDRVNISVAIIPMAEEFGWDFLRKHDVRASMMCEQA